MSRTLQSPTGEIITPSQQPCEYMPTSPICIPFEGFGTYVIYWVTAEQWDTEWQESNCWGIAVQNPDISKYRVSWNNSEDYGREFSEDPEYSYEELLDMYNSDKEEPLHHQWIHPLSVYDHGMACVYPTGTRSADRWDTTSSVALWYPLAHVRKRVVCELVPLFRVLEINRPNLHDPACELIRKDTKQRVVPYKFYGELQALLYVSSHVQSLRQLLPELESADSSPEKEGDLSTEDWKIVEQCAMRICKIDCMLQTAECGYVEVAMDFIDTNGHTHPCEILSYLSTYDSVYNDWNNQTLKDIIKDYACPEIAYQLKSHRKFTCPKCGEHRLYTKYRLPSYMVCNSTVALQQLSDPKADSTETYIGAGYPHIGPSTPDPIELETASCSNCGYVVTEEVRKLLGKTEWSEDSEIFQKYSIPEDWGALLDSLCPPETW